MSIPEISNTNSPKPIKGSEHENTTSTSKPSLENPEAPSLKIEKVRTDPTIYPKSEAILKNGSIEIFRTLASLVGVKAGKKVLALGEKHTAGSKSRKFLLDNLKNFQELWYFQKLLLFLYLYLQF